MAKRNRHQNSANSFEIDEDVMCASIATKLGLDDDTVERVLDGELVFLDERGLVVHEGKSQNEDKVYERTADVRMEEIAEAIVQRTDISREVVVRILHAEAEFISSQG